MIGPCDIKTSNKALNEGLEAFSNAFKQTGGKITESLQFALQEIEKANPDMSFDPNSFVDYVVGPLKEEGIIPKNYTFGKKKRVERKTLSERMEERMFSQDLYEEKLLQGKRSSNEKLKKEVEKAANKMKGLSPDQKKSFSRKVFTTFEEKGMINDSDVKNFYAEQLGIPSMSEAMKEQIGKMSDAMAKQNDVEKRVKSTIKELQADKDANKGPLTSSQDKEYSKKFESLAKERSEALKNVAQEQAAFAEMLREKRFWLHQLGDYMPLNLMNPRSLGKNISGAIVDGVYRGIASGIASPASYFTSFFTGIHSNPIGSRVKGALKGDFKAKASLAWKYGKTDFSNEITAANHLNSLNRFKQAMAATGMEKWKGFISAALKIHPDFISKGLTVPDAMVFEMVRMAELNRISEAKGLKGAEKEAFLLEPDAQSTAEAQKLAEKATFKQDIPGGIDKFLKYDPHEKAKKLIEEGKYSPLSAKMRTGIISMGIKSIFPFIKTPVNIMRVASKILLPEYELGKALYEAKKAKDNPIERQRLIIDGISRAVVGFHIRQVFMQMVGMGLISAGFDDEDKKSKDFVEQKLGGPNRINWSAFIRGLSFQDMKEKKGDHIIELGAVGALGIAGAIYAHAFSKYDKNEVEERRKYNQGLMDAVGIPASLGMATISTGLDQTFFSGFNQVFQAFLGNEPNNYKGHRFFINQIANVFTGIVPSTAQQLSMAASPDQKRQIDAQLPFHENLANVLGYKFLGKYEGLKNKYFSLASPGEAKKQKNYMFFDNYLGRVLEGELDLGKTVTTESTDDPISRLYNAMRDVSKEERDKLFPASIDAAQSFGKRGKSVKIKLSPQQLEYLQEQASVQRMMLATPYIMSPEFKKDDFEARVEKLKSYYSEGLKTAKMNLREHFPDITDKVKEEIRKKKKSN